MKIYPSINEGLNAFNKKIYHYLISGPIRNKINEFYFNKNTEKSETTQFNSDRDAGIPIGIVDFQSKIHYSDQQTFFLTFNYKKIPLKIKFLQSRP